MQFTLKEAGDVIITVMPGTHEFPANKWTSDYRSSPGIYSTQKKVGCTLAHIGMLSRALQWMSIFEDGDTVTSLEQDAEIVEGAMERMVDIPDDTDALWLGNSAYGATVDLEPVEGYPEICKAPMMMATHAFAMLTKRYAEERLRLVVQSITDPAAKKGGLLIGQDAYCVNKGLHRTMNVYALRMPMFVQDGKFRDKTSIVLEPENNTYKSL